MFWLAPPAPSTLFILETIGGYLQSLHLRAPESASGRRGGGTGEQQGQQQGQ